MHPAPAAFIAQGHLPLAIRPCLRRPRPPHRRAHSPGCAPPPPRRALRLPPVSHAGNGASPQPSLPEGDSDASKSPNAQLPSDPAVVKEQLLRIITHLINDNEQIRQAELLIRQLESAGKPPLTQQFTEMAISGSWKLMFSSTRTTTKGNVRIRQIGQVIQPEKKLLTNNALWTFPDKYGVEQISATLQVQCSYQFVMPSRLKVQLKEHTVKILSRKDSKPNQMPTDMKPLITELQLALPIEFFDPSGLLDITYIDPGFRLTRFMSKKVAGARNVFTRTS